MSTSSIPSVEWRSVLVLRRLLASILPRLWVSWVRNYWNVEQYLSCHFTTTSREEGAGLLFYDWCLLPKSGLYVFVLVINRTTHHQQIKSRHDATYFLSCWLQQHLTFLQHKTRPSATPMYCGWLTGANNSHCRLIKFTKTSYIYRINTNRN